MKRVMLLMAVLCVSGGAASADYIDPPGWDSNAYFTHQSWSFDETNDLGVAVVADDGYVSPGTPVATQLVGSWMDDLDGPQGGWLFKGGSEGYSGTLATFDIPNTYNAGLKKELWFQITLESSNPYALQVGIDVKADTGESFTFNDDLTYELLGPGEVGYWIRATGTFEIFPQPAAERMIIYGTLAKGEILIADQVDIDTRCVPEPSTLVLLVGTGLLGLVGYLRRRK